jgi:hypothetical protein
MVCATLTEGCYVCVRLHCMQPSQFTHLTIWARVLPPDRGGLFSKVCPNTIGPCDHILGRIVDMSLEIAQ